MTGDHSRTLMRSLAATVVLAVIAILVWYATGRAVWGAVAWLSGAFVWGCVGREA